MKIGFCAIALLLEGCVTTSDVVPMAGGQYLVTGHASGGLNAGKGTATAAQKAAAYCAQQNRSMEIVSTEFHGVAAVGGESTSLVFRCE
jgi:hypothetical protein